MMDQMEISFQAIAENEAFARMVISAFLVRRDPVLSVMSEVRTAVSEAVTNAVVHAYGAQEAGRIVMRASLDDERIDIEIEDSGCGIEDVQQAMKPFYTSKPEEERSGMGFALMLSFMDRVHVESSPGNGTVVRMEKLLGSGEMHAH